MKTSPLQQRHEDAGANLIPYGPQTSIVAMIEPMELEYAVFRKGAAILDEPQRGLIRLTGTDRDDYLHRMLSNGKQKPEQGQGYRAFLLNTKGRIMADLLVLPDEKETLVDVDIHQTTEFCEELDKMLFTEDVVIEDITEKYHRVSLHGPAAAALVEAITEKEVYEIEPMHHQLLWAGETPIRIYRHDEVGGLGLHLWLPADHLQSVWDKLLKFGEEMGDVRIAGWLAYNIARIEGGCPIFHVDFGTNSLPHETGLLEEAVSFTKGCYRGQEIVARMQSLGHPAKALVGFEGSQDMEVPLAEAPVYESQETDAKVVGNVTSSTFAPMRSQIPIGFAIMKWGYHKAGTQLFVQTDQGAEPITITESLAHLPQ